MNVYIFNRFSSRILGNIWDSYEVTIISPSKNRTIYRSFQKRSKLTALHKNKSYGVTLTSTLSCMILYILPQTINIVLHAKINLELS